MSGLAVRVSTGVGTLKVASGWRTECEQAERGMSLSSQQGQIIQGPGNHMKAFGLYPEGSVDGFQQRTVLVSRIYYVPALC